MLPLHHAPMHFACNSEKYSIAGSVCQALTNNFLPWAESAGRNLHQPGGRGLYEVGWLWYNHGEERWGGEGMTNLWRRARDYAAYHGVGYTLRRIAEKLTERTLHPYERIWSGMRTPEAELEAQRQSPPEAGLISVLIPVYNTDPALLQALAASLQAQTYPNWEACLYDDCSPRGETLRALDAVAALDTRFHVYRGEHNQGISGSTNSAASLAAGEWLALCDHDDLLEPDALWQVARVIAQEQPDLIYSDEDKVTENGRWHTDPHFKPDFCPDNLREGNYICHLMVVRKALFEQVGGLRGAFNGSQDHDLALRCTEVTRLVAHIPRVLYHWRTVRSSVSHQNLMRCVEASRRAVEEHMARIGWPGQAEIQRGNLRLRYEIKGAPSVDVFVMAAAGDEAEACARQLEADAWPDKRVSVVRMAPHERYAAMNRAAEDSRADMLLFLDASVTDISAGLIEELMMYAQRDDVGAVTPRLLSRRGRITHGGFAVGMEGLAQCREQNLPSHANGWHLLMQTSHNVAAVSAACVMIRRDHFIPFDEAYREGLGAVDWSLSLIQRGLRHVFTPHVQGVCESEALLLTGRARHDEDAVRFAARWPGVQDPCYSALFSRKKANYRLARRLK